MQYVYQLYLGHGHVCLNWVHMSAAPSAPSQPQTRANFGQGVGALGLDPKGKAFSLQPSCSWTSVEMASSPCSNHLYSWQIAPLKPVQSCREPV